MRTVFAASPREPTYTTHHDRTTPVRINDVRRPVVLGQDYGFYMGDGRTNLGINVHELKYNYNVLPENIQKLANIYNIIVDNNCEENRGKQE
jgi:hypothetical protein